MLLVGGVLQPFMAKLSITKTNTWKNDPGISFFPNGLNLKKKEKKEAVFTNSKGLPY